MYNNFNYLSYSDFDRKRLDKNKKKKNNKPCMRSGVFIVKSSNKKVAGYICFKIFLRNSCAQSESDGSKSKNKKKQRASSHTQKSCEKKKIKKKVYPTYNMSKLCL